MSEDDPSEEEPTPIASEDRRLAALAHVSVMGGLVVPGIGAFLVPLLIKLTHGRESHAVDRAATEATNLGITLSVVQITFNVLSVPLVGGVTPSFRGLASTSFNLVDLNTTGSFVYLVGAVVVIPLIVSIIVAAMAVFAAWRTSRGFEHHYPLVIRWLQPRALD